ncbi:hypothetical protein DFP73DRAFT_539451 [Morchella snyderi]|nr:hypothetical protein DFP73DRAFT_539451 [Morchella snyderi]
MKSRALGGVPTSALLALDTAMCISVAFSWFRQDKTTSSLLFRCLGYSGIPWCPSIREDESKRIEYVTLSIFEKLASRMLVRVGV